MGSLSDLNNIKKNAAMLIYSLIVFFTFSILKFNNC